MSTVALLFVLPAAFAVCAWSGHTLARHYQDRWELAATAAIGACLLGALGVAGYGRAESAGWREAALGVVMAAGMFAGYDRAGAARRR
ncbi:hypothetical protein [Roseisolibacter sp. H3M3-2]|uniref:hypothetical protein n=1 Tax=Roseisolibacter sp. H3M3-2 TaxID=3031323 RepID=UPI0023DC9404|nr:hypothetical protein [Roseisolibacter sp. H3M3-2]MDF1504872.1 hypothetical protein [Roseisolibacter sp. H3M3-2]